MVYEKYGIMLKYRVYQKPYVQYSIHSLTPGSEILDFAKFKSVDSKSTWKHINQYLAQLSEAVSKKYTKLLTDNSFFMIFFSSSAFSC